MKLLLVTSSYSSSGQGTAAAGVFVHDFAVALREAGAEVRVVAPAVGASGEPGVQHFQVPRLPLSLLNPLSPFDWSAILRTLSAGRKAVQQACLEDRPDHILALWAAPAGAWARQAASRFSIPYSVWTLGSDIWGLGRLPLIRGYIGGVLRGAAHCFADGIKLAADTQRIGGRGCAFLPSSRRFGPAAERLPNRTGPYRLAFLGRWHPNKGIDLLLDALLGLDDTDWARLEAVRIHGGGPLEPEVQRRVDALVRAGRPVSLGGYLDHGGAYELLAWADFVAIPSRIESIPVVFSDAMQIGRPVIASPVGDLPGLMQSYGCGIVADAASAAGLMRALHQALHAGTGEFMPGVAKAAQAFDVRQAAAACLAVLAGNNAP